MLKKSLAAVAVLCAAVLVLVAQSGQSADPDGNADVPLAQAGDPRENAERPESAGRSRVRRLPNYYGQVGLSPRQRETIYNLQAAYADRIEELERQLESLKARRDEEIENVLTRQQQARLHQLLEAAARRRASRSADSDDAASVVDKKP